VCEEWRNFQNFAKWFEKNYKNEIMEKWQLDKDILVKRNKVYSPETCAFVPREINCLFTKTTKVRGNLPIGVTKEYNKFRAQSCSNKKRYLGTFTTPEEAFQSYKKSKEIYIKEIADKWKGLISEQVYEAMYNYKVEIND